ncbi:phosphate ABC transporter permease [Chlorogloeopsis sp. ULAP02]|uniref:phosphate ABC transporter permease n=1 Tax=Chlorogloeopsis sp. ULAP02 TaxID=3107926 RepID=UPI003136BA2E
MLVPLTREKFNQLVPLIATGQQYKYYWGKFPDFLQRLLISVVAAAIVLVVKVIFRLDFGPIVFLLGLIGAFYWLWGPVFWASMQNAKCRRYKYSGFFRGRVLDWWITDELVGKQETVDGKGDLVIVENREKRINLEVGDDTGFTAQIKAPLRVEHKAITRGQVAEMVVMSNRPDLSRIEQITDVYIPRRELWVNDYPYLRRDYFPEVSRRLRDRQQERRSQRYRPEVDVESRESRRNKGSRQSRRWEEEEMDNY